MLLYLSITHRVDGGVPSRLIRWTNIVRQSVKELYAQPRWQKENILEKNCVNHLSVNSSKVDELQVIELYGKHLPATVIVINSVSHWPS